MNLGMLPILLFNLCVVFYGARKSYRDLKASKDKRGFVMRVPDYETDYADADSDSEADADNSLVASGRRFACDELYMRFVIAVYYILRD